MQNDYAREAVPESERKKWLSISLVWIAVGIDLSAMLFGAELGKGMNFNDALLSVIIGSAILGVLAAFCAYVGAVTGLSTSMISRFTFGISGAKFVSLFIAISLLGWFGVQTGFFAENAFAAVKGAVGLELPMPLLAGIGGILMMTTAIFGYRAIEKLSSWSVPLLLILVILAVILAIKQFGLSELKAPVENVFSFGMAISLVISIFVTGAVISPDVSRWAKTKKDAVLASFFGFFFGNSFMIVVAMILSRIMDESSLTTIMITVGLGIPGILVLILAQWTTNTSNAYSSGLSLSVIFTRTNKAVLTLVAGILGTLLAVLGIYDYFINFLSIMTLFIAPIGGVYTAYYYIGGPKLFDTLNDKAFKFLPLTAWALGTLISWFTTEAPIGLELFTFTTIPSLDSFVIAFISQAIFLLIFKQRGQKGAI
ncbi:cytosine permease [Lederbergia wuyishanensis]|uniref:Cytosine permease n=1 Tax=Lederbergia wuyishanensis TaxID=1347903 RepID=A0ABU0DA48_9BACI|nr:cytosine permease [Lederbergia wuyishanensis]MCJ8008462.1 cytosine permease [Lederbergia wuyishanensis]MDQ0345205.1 cytosine permease [Lederbergia wuyishanensis]